MRNSTRTTLPKLLLAGLAFQLTSTAYCYPFFTPQQRETILKNYILEMSSLSAKKALPQVSKTLDDEDAFTNLQDLIRDMVFDLLATEGPAKGTMVYHPRGEHINLQSKEDVLRYFGASEGSPFSRVLSYHVTGEEFFAQVPHAVADVSDGVKAQYARLGAFMLQELSEVTAFVMGDEDSATVLPMYIIGKTKSGALLGIRFNIVWT